MAEVPPPIVVGAIAGIACVGLIIVAAVHWHRIEGGMIRRMVLVEGVLGTLGLVSAVLALRREEMWLAIFLALAGGTMLAPAVRRLAAPRR